MFSCGAHVSRGTQVDDQLELRKFKTQTQTTTADYLHFLKLCEQKLKTKIQFRFREIHLFIYGDESEPLIMNLSLSSSTSLSTSSTTSSSSSSSSSTSWFSGIVRGRSGSAKMSSNSSAAAGFGDSVSPIVKKNHWRGVLFKYGPKPIQVRVFLLLKKMTFFLVFWMKLMGMRIRIHFFGFGLGS